MLNLIRQIAAVMTTSLYTLQRRLGSSLVVIIGVGVVVAVLATILAMANGLLRSVEATGRSDRAIVLRAGSSGEVTSVLMRNDFNTILNTAGIARNADGTPLVSGELLATVGVRHRTEKGTNDVSVMLRGVGSEVLAVRNEMRMVSGRAFEPGKYELIVGQTAARRYGLEVGQTLSLRGSDWRIVGIYTSGGDTHESELMTNRDTLASALGWSHYHSMLVKLESEAAFPKFEAAIKDNPALSVDVMRESEFFEQQSESIGKLVFIAAYVLGGIMGIGAIFAALNTMYASVNVRAREIAILRALGYGGELIVFSVVIEAIILTLLGSACGLALAWYMLNGVELSTSYGGLNTQLVFDVKMTPQTSVIGVVIALIIGLAGSLFPAMAAARVPVTTALREI
jgi:putative ABC transport system permease protein